jgi:hypothetical protein
MALALRENRAIRDIEAIGERPNGGFSLFLTPRPYGKRAAPHGGWSPCFVEVTDRKTASLKKRSRFRGDQRD